MKELFNQLLREMQEAENRAQLDNIVSLAKFVPVFVALAKACELNELEMKSELSECVREWVMINKDSLLFDVAEHIPENIVSQIADHAASITAA